MLLDGGDTSQETIKLVLANLYQTGERLDWSVAYRIALSDPNSKRTTVIKKSRKEFWELFQSRYDSQFPGGMELKVAKQDAVFSHHPGSQAIGSMRQSGKNDICSLRVPNAAGLHSQFKPLSKIWNSCIEDLSGFTRAKSKQKTADATGLASWIALPIELRQVNASPMQPFWDWVDQSAPEEHGYKFVKAGFIAPWFGYEQKEKLTPTQSLAITHGLAAMGWQIAPSYLHTNLPYHWEQEFAVYRSSTPGIEEPQIPGVIRLLYLVTALAAADGIGDPRELDTFQEFLAHEINSDTDARYVTACRTALLRDTQVASKALRSIAKHVPSRNRRAVLRILTKISAADGAISIEEQQLLSKMASYLDLPANTPEDFIREVIEFTETQVQSASPGKRSAEPIPKRPESIPAFSLDHNKIRILAAETREVVAILASVMNEDEPESTGTIDAIPIESIPPTLSIPEWFGDLPPQFHGLLVEIIKVDDISADDFSRLASAAHLIPEAALQGINAWSDEELGDFLLEQGDPILVYRQLLPTI